MPRKIIHLDLDAFFCSVEELNDPSLVGKAFAVGGQPDERGVVASCSYAARGCGLHSAMAMAQAVRLCPGLIIVTPHYSAYRQASQQVMDILRQLTPLVEQISIDEAFLDISDMPEPAEQVGRRLQASIRTGLRLPCSLGIAANKLLAKIACDVGKAAALKKGKGSQVNASPPNAITVVPPGQEAAFLAPLPVQALWGVGPKTAERLADLGIYTIHDLASWPEEALVERFGKNGHDLYQRARGIDNSPIVTSHAAKSISQETTFTKDVSNYEVLHKTLLELSISVGRDLRKSGLAASTIKLKLRWPDFTTLTRQTTLNQPTDLDDEIYQAAEGLFMKVWKPHQAVRLLGVGASGLGPFVRQLSLWDAHPEKDHRLQTTLDELRQRYGDRAVRRGSELKDEGDH